MWGQAVSTNSGLAPVAFHDLPDALAGEGSPPSIQEQDPGIRVSTFQFQADFEVIVKCGNGVPAEWDDPLPIASRLVRLTSSPPDSCTSA